jgi:hypothetical protein
MLTQKEIDRLNGVLQNKTFVYNQGVFHYDLEGENDFDFKFQILGYKKMISVGEYYDYLRVSVTLLNFRDELSKILFLRKGANGEFLNKYFKENMYYFKMSLSNEIKSIMKMFEPDTRIIIEHIEVELDTEKESLQEQKMTRQAIRNVVKDIVTILKNNEEGEFNLPNNDEGMGYSFNRFPVEFSVELYVEHDDTLDGYQLNAEYSHEDDVIEIIIRYNPDDLRTSMYDIVGELNEVIAHELEHSLQGYRGEFDDDDRDEVTDPTEYYLQPHEIPAQIAGFKRIARLRKLPLETVIRQWFDSHGDIHSMNKKQQEKVINTLLNYKKG